MVQSDQQGDNDNMDVCTRHGHRWPRSFAYATSSSIGRVELMICDNCLAVKVVTVALETKTEQIVVPTNNVSYPET